MARARGRGAAGVTRALPPRSHVLHLPRSPPIFHALEALFFPPPRFSPGPPAAVGCAVGPWGPWSGCSSPCGVGSKARSRQVTVPPRHGGEPCPDLKQRRGCLGEHQTCGTAEGNAGPAGDAHLPRASPSPGAAAIPAACPGVSLTIHVSPLGCSSPRGGQDITRLLQPGLQGCLAKSWAAAAGGAVRVGTGLGLLCTSPQNCHPSAQPPAAMAPFQPPNSRPLCTPPSHYPSMAPLHPFLDPRPICNPLEPIPFHPSPVAPLQPPTKLWTLCTPLLELWPLCTPPEPLPFHLSPP